MSAKQSFFFSRKYFHVVLLISLLRLIAPSSGFAQFEPFSTDSIPLIGEEVLFTFHFKGNISKKEAHKRTHFFLDREMDPYSGAFIRNTDDSVVCRVVDYLEIETGMLHVFGMYMTYDMQLLFHDNAVDLTIRNITFMEKSHYERQEETSRELYFTEYTGKEIMVDKSYSQLFKRDASGKVTKAAINRFNTIVRNLRIYFVD